MKIDNLVIVFALEQQKKYILPTKVNIYQKHIM